jgi:hypothetical protein
VRIGYAGGSFDEELERDTCWGVDGTFKVRAGVCSSTTVSVCGIFDFPLPSVAFLIVRSLAFLGITWTRWEMGPSSSDPCSGVVVGEVGVGKYSDVAEALETSEAFDDVSWGGSATGSVG